MRRTIFTRGADAFRRTFRRGQERRRAAAAAGGRSSGS